ncbi:hypothetical protein EJB05_15529, partial [Eragrostis curvula]
MVESTRVGLALKPLHRCKCVAKAWHDLIDGPHHRKKLPQTLQGFFFMDKDTYSRRRSVGRFGFINLLPKSAHLDIDLSFSFLMKRPEIKVLTLSDSSNGLFLFEHGLKSAPSDRLGYIVCNPATKQWVTVPRYDSPPPANAIRGETRYSYLVFDPSVSSHFHLVQFWLEFRQKHDNGSSESEEDSHEAWYRYKYGTWTPGSWSDWADHESGDTEEAWHRYKYGTWTPGSWSGRTGHVESGDEGSSGKEVSLVSVHTYSSETGMWSHIPSDWDEPEEQGLEEWRYQGLEPGRGSRRAFVNSMLHFIISDRDEIAAADAQGATQKIIPVPNPTKGGRWAVPGYIAQSQGRLHYINQESDARLSIWVLEDYYTDKWVLKHAVGVTKQFGKKRRLGHENDCHVVAMHPDGNVVFIVQGSNLKLISYDMDYKLVRVVGTLKDESCKYSFGPTIVGIVVLDTEIKKSRKERDRDRGVLRRDKGVSISENAKYFEKINTMGDPKGCAVAAAGFPDDPLLEILCRVPAKSLCRFKCVSKPWRDLIADLLRCRKFPQTLEGFFYGSRFQSYGNFTNLVGKSDPPVDPSFSFLTKVPGIQDLSILGSINGLLLFRHVRRSGMYGYIVCNPATEQWMSVPKASLWGEKREDDEEMDEDDEEMDEDDQDDEECDEDYWDTGAHHFLMFDPAVSSHFHLVQLGYNRSDDRMYEVAVYSSETGLWSCKTEGWAFYVEGGGCERWKRGEDEVKSELGSAYVNDMLHVPVCHHYRDDLRTQETQIVAVDVQGNVCKVMRWPGENEIATPSFIGQSQGRLHCINGHQKSDNPNGRIIGLSIWVLEDHDAAKWVLKQHVSSWQLFGRVSCQESDYAVVAFHPDQNLVFFVQGWNQKLLSYDMDSMEVRAVCTLGQGFWSVTPYVPCFADLPVKRLCFPLLAFLTHNRRRGSGGIRRSCRLR